MAVTGLKGLKKAATPKGKRAHIHTSDEYEGCGKGFIRDPHSGNCISLSVYNKKYNKNKQA